MRILYTRPDGGLSVVHSALRDERFKTDEEYRQFIWSRGVPADAINPIDLPDEYVLPDREFRDAWAQSGAGITHDLTKATNIQLTRLRATRDALLVKYDGLQARANDLNDTVAFADIKIKKQQLRDATNALKLLKPNSIDDVKLAKPDLSGY